MTQCPQCRRDLSAAELENGRCPACGHSWSEPTMAGPAPPAATVFSPEQIDRAWGALLTADLTPATTIKAPPAPARSSSGLRIPCREVTERPASPPDTPGRAEFELLAVLGTGGMGVVYEAVQTSLDRRVALKRIRAVLPRNEETRKAFLSEACVTGDLDHPNIVPIYELGEDTGGQLFYTMKKVGGTAWQAVFYSRSEEENLETLMRVADAVAFAHHRGIVHRDLKPENIMLGEFGEVFVMDWGLAAATRSGGQGLASSDVSALCGTPCYMAPEMARGEAAAIGTRSDIYLLGAILYQLATGQPPHAGPNAKACLHAAAENAIQPTGRTDELIEVARKAMATVPGDRHPTVKAFQEAIRAYRTHAESNRLTARAATRMGEAAASAAYGDFSKALFAYEEAQTLWPENPRAVEGLRQARLAYASCAHRKGDFELAESQLLGEEPSHQDLLREVRAARKKRDARIRRIRWLSAAVILLLLLSACIAYGSFKSWQHQQERIAQERDLTDRANYANTINLAQRRIAEGGFGDARELLKQTRPQDRQWEWGRLMHVCRLYELEIVSRSGGGVAFSPQGDRISTYGDAYGDDSWQLWDAVTGELQFGGPLRHGCVRFSPQGRYLHLGGPTFDTFTGETEPLAKEREVKGRTHAITADGKGRLVVVNEGTQVLWRNGGAVPLNPDPDRGQTLYRACFSEDGTRLLLGFKSGAVVLYDAQSGEQVARFEGFTKPIYAVALDSSCTRAMAGSEDGRALIWRVSAPGAAPLVLEGHTQGVRAVAFHPQGKGIATASEDGTARYWSPKGKQLQWYAFRGRYRRAVVGVAFSPRGDELVTMQGLTVNVWNLEASDRAFPLLPEELGVDLLALAPNGQFLVGQRPVRGVPAVIRPSTGEQLRVFRAKEGGANTVALSPGGSHLLVSTKDALISYDLKSGAEVFRVKRPGTYGVLAFSPTGGLFADAQGGAPVTLRDAVTGAMIRTLGPPLRPLPPVLFAPDGRQVLVGDELYDPAGGEIVTQLKPEPKCSQAAFSANGRVLVTGGKELQVWDTVSGELKRTLAQPKNRISIHPLRLAVNADGSRIAGGSRKGELTVWDGRTGEILHEVVHGQDDIEWLSREEGNTALFATRYGAWARLDLATGTCSEIADQPRNGGRIEDVRMEHDLAAVVQVDPHLGLWDAKGTLLRELTGVAAESTCAAVSPDSKRILTAGQGPPARSFRADAQGPHAAIWDADSGQLAGTIRTSRPPHTLRFSPAGDRALLVTDDSESAIWDLKTRQKMPGLEGLKYADDAAFSPDGTWLLTGTQGGNVDWNARLWDTRTGRQERVLVGHTGMVRATAFSPDGSLLATGSEDGTLRLWDARTGDEVRVLRGHEATVRGIDFSCDGSRILSGGYDSTLRIWETRTGRELIVLNSPEKVNERVRFHGRLVEVLGQHGRAYAWMAADWSKTPEELEADALERRRQRSRYVTILPKERHFLEKQTVTLEPAEPGQVVRFTTDGSDPADPTGTSQLYQAPVTIERTTVVRAVAYQEHAAGSLSTATFIRKELLPALKAPAAGQPGLRFSTYRTHYGEYSFWEFRGAKLIRSGVCGGLGESLLEAATDGGVRYEGLLRVPSDGLYRFSVETQRGNGCRVTLDGQSLIDVRELHLQQTDANWIGLKAGLHRFEMTTYRYEHRPDVQVHWEGPGFQRTPLAGASFVQGSD